MAAEAKVIRPKKFDCRFLGPSFNLLIAFWINPGSSSPSGVGAVEVGKIAPKGFVLDKANWAAKKDIPLGLSNTLPSLSKSFAALLTNVNAPPRTKLFVTSSTKLPKLELVDCSTPGKGLPSKSFIIKGGWVSKPNFPAPSPYPKFLCSKGRVEVVPSGWFNVNCPASSASLNNPLKVIAIKQFSQEDYLHI